MALAKKLGKRVDIRILFVVIFSVEIDSYSINGWKKEENHRIVLTR